MGIYGVKNIFNKKSNLQSILDWFSLKFRRYREELYMSNDLLFTLTYMASISTANLTRDKIFSSISDKKEYCPSKYFGQIRELAQNWHYDYANACELISTKVPNDRMRELLNRLSNAISAGEPDNEFLTKEWKLFKTKRKDEFERDLDTTKEWSNAYTALLVSTSLVAIIILLSVILYNIGDPADTLFSTMVIVFFMAFLGVGLLFSSSPKDTKVHSLSVKSKEQVYIHKWIPLTLVLSTLAVIIFTIIPTFFGSPDFFINIKGVGMILAGVIMLPVGIEAKRDIAKINKRDESYTTFIRSLGSIVSGSGLTVPKALQKIDPKNLGELKDMSQELYKKLATGLDPTLCWERFVGETGSYLIYKFTNVFVDAVNFGGNAEVVGELVSSSNLELVLLRMKRERISKGFTSLVIPLHVAMVGLLLFIGQILTIFTTIISTLFTQFNVEGGELGDIMPSGMGGMSLGIFGGVPVELLGQFVIIVIIILTIANILAIVAVKGGPMYLSIYYGIPIFILSGVLMIITPPLVKMAFSFNGALDSLAGGF